jgi:uncharacterized protein (TIGR03118 family)
LAIGSTTSGSFLYAANAAENNVYVYDSTFANVGEFSDPNIPSGFVPYGIQAIGGQIYVTYASLSQPGGFVDIFNPDGTVKRVVSDPLGTHLNQPWGLAMAPANFGTFSNDLLVGNVKDGMINAFNPNTGAFVGWLSYTDGKPITIPGLWALQFGRGSVNNGMTNQLFFTAGPNNFADGLLGMIFPIIPNGPGLATWPRVRLNACLPSRSETHCAMIIGVVCVPERERPPALKPIQQFSRPVVERGARAWQQLARSA